MEKSQKILRSLSYLHGVKVWIASEHFAYKQQKLHIAMIAIIACLNKTILNTITLFFLWLAAGTRWQQFFNICSILDILYHCFDFFCVLVCASAIV